MINIDSIAAQVKLNCNISDARYWGYYLPCGLLLRLRDLYRIENKFKPSEKVDPDKIADWIGTRERLWQELETHDFHHIVVGAKKYRPFDVKGINAVLQGHGFVYGAGYGNLLKPVFTLAELIEKNRIGRYDIYVLGREISRDLSTVPAMIQGNTIILRSETMNVFFWDKFEEMKARKCSGALDHAFAEYGISKGELSRIPAEKLEKDIAKITSEEISTYIYHELGEASQRRILGNWWKELLMRLPYGRAEMFLRGLKDVLADTCDKGLLSHVIENKKAGSLFFYIALLGGFRKSILRDIGAAYDEFVKTRDWDLIETARIDGYNRTKACVRTLREIFDNGTISAEVIEREIMPSIV
jgi:hypothetical protein